MPLTTNVTDATVVLKITKERGRMKNRKGIEKGWLIFFYSVPSRPVSSRMKIWRKLSKAGAVQLKGAVYILPMQEDHYEFFQWLVSEVALMGGDAAFTKVSAIETMKDDDIRNLFNAQRAVDYQVLEKDLGNIELKLNSLKKGSGSLDMKNLPEQLMRISKNCDEIGKKDFFSCKAGAELRRRIGSLNAMIDNLSGIRADIKPAMIQSRKISDYQGRRWLCRKRPFVDRMASAWLIRRFIDNKAVFEFSNEKTPGLIAGNTVTFDMSEGEFTHQGELCTFEVILRSFGLKDRELREIAEIVHDLDMKDDRFKRVEAKGIEIILHGIRRAEADDHDALEKGMAVFEMLYASKSL